MSEWFLVHEVVYLRLYLVHQHHPEVLCATTLATLCWRNVYQWSVTVPARSWAVSAILLSHYGSTPDDLMLTPRSDSCCCTHQLSFLHGASLTLECLLLLKSGDITWWCTWASCSSCAATSLPSTRDTALISSFFSGRHTLHFDLYDLLSAHLHLFTQRTLYCEKLDISFQKSGSDYSVADSGCLGAGANQNRGTQRASVHWKRALNHILTQVWCSSDFFEKSSHTCLHDSHLWGDSATCGVTAWHNLISSDGNLHHHLNECVSWWGSTNPPWSSNTMAPIPSVCPWGSWCSRLAIQMWWHEELNFLLFTRQTCNQNALCTSEHVNYLWQVCLIVAGISHHPELHDGRHCDRDLLTGQAMRLFLQL